MTKDPVISDEMREMMGKKEVKGDGF